MINIDVNVRCDSPYLCEFTLSGGTGKMVAIYDYVKKSLTDILTPEMVFGVAAILTNKRVVSESVTIKEVKTGRLHNVVAV